VNSEDLAYVGELMADGKLRSVVERTYPLSEAAAALAELGEGHARGKIVITV
jgi:NADPH:quinone reductase-like Zn-dependent oxidoreductase